MPRMFWSVRLTHATMGCGTMPGSRAKIDAVFPFNLLVAHHHANLVPLSSGVPFPI